MKYCDNHLQKFFLNKKGSFTIEASLIFPIIFILVIVFIFISIVIYQKVYLYYISSVAVERASYNWSNSYKDPITGEFNIGEKDGLYWRLADDNITGLLFGITDTYEPLEIEINSNNSSNSLPEKKLLSIANILPSGIEGKLIYQHNLERKIIIELESQLKLPSFITTVIGDKLSVRTTSIITEPVEFIRTIDFIRMYANLLSDNKESIKKILNKQKMKE